MQAESIHGSCGSPLGFGRVVGGCAVQADCSETISACMPSEAQLAALNDGTSDVSEGPRMARLGVVARMHGHRNKHSTARSTFTKKSRRCAPHVLHVACTPKCHDRVLMEMTNEDPPDLLGLDGVLRSWEPGRDCESLPVRLTRSVTLSIGVLAARCAIAAGGASLGPEATAHSVVECSRSGVGLKRGSGRARSDSAVECGAPGRYRGASRKVT